jgi:hypothetical protein
VTGRCEGAKPVPADVIAVAKKLARRNAKTGKKRSLRQVAAELAVVTKQVVHGEAADRRLSGEGGMGTVHVVDV